jgi:hypothetical protein
MRRIWIALMVAFGIGLSWWWTQGETPQPKPDAIAGANHPRAPEPDAISMAGLDDSSVSPERQSSSAEPAKQAPTPSATAAAESAHLPATGLPLRETAAELLAASRSGSLPATRRLMQELSDCQRQRWASLRMDMMIAFEDSPRAHRRNGERFREAMSTAAETVADLAEQCADLPSDFDEAILFELQRRAADAGDLAGQLAFALVPALSLGKSLQQLDRLEVYKASAPQALQRALEQGSGQAVAGFMDAYEYVFEGWRGRPAEGTAMQTQAIKKMMEALRPLTPIQQVLGEDLVAAYRYALLCKRVCNGSDQARADNAVERLAVALEPVQRRQARDEAAELYDQYFHAQPRPDDIDLEAIRDAVLGFRR